MGYPKVYLSRSNEADPNHIDVVRAALNEIRNIDVRMYQGGKYSNHDVIHADYLILVPPKTSLIHSPDGKGIDIFIGKGQYYQITDFSDISDIGSVNIPKCYAALFISPKEFILCAVENNLFALRDGDYKNYGSFRTKRKPSLPVIFTHDTSYFRFVNDLRSKQIRSDWSNSCTAEEFPDNSDYINVMKNKSVKVGEAIHYEFEFKFSTIKNRSTKLSFGAMALFLKRK